MRKQAQVEKGISELEKKEDEGDLDEEANRKKKTTRVLEGGYMQ